MPRETSSLSYTQNGSTDDPSNLHGLSLIHRVSDTPGDQFPSWSGDLFVGSLVFDYIARLDPDTGMSEVEKIATPQTGRVRDVRTAPDGSIWFLSVSNSALYRIAPR